MKFNTQENSTTMEPSHLFTFLLPLFCLLSSTIPVAALRQPPSTALLAADALHTRGYSIFSSLLISISSLSTNFSGTLFTPPDSAFSHATANFFNNRRPRPRPSSSLLLYHTLKPPLILSWLSLSSGTDGDELPTFYDNNCLYLHRNPFAGEVTISSSPINNGNEVVSVRQPDLYVDDHLTVHGIDGVLDPTFAMKCGVRRMTDPTPVTGPPLVNRTFVDRAIGALRRKGYNIVVTAMENARSELLSLNSVTVFAVSDKNLFLNPDGFRYNFRHHVVPMRHRIADLAKAAVAGTEFTTLARNRAVWITTVNGAIRVDGVAVGEEVYSNRKITVIAVNRSLDDVIESQWNPPITTSAVSDNLAFSPISFPGGGVPPSVNLPRVPSPAPVNFGECLMDFVSMDEGIGNYASSFVNPNIVNPPESPIQFAAQNWVSPPAPTPETDDLIGRVCDMDAAESLRGGEGDVYCPAAADRKLRERERHVESLKPLDGSQDLSHKGIMADIGNIADDLFFYI